MTPVGRVAVLGLGEAGAVIAADLVAAGREVHGFDPVPAASTPAGVVRHADARVAVSGADLVLSVTPGARARDALTGTVDALPPGAVYADLSTAAPAVERELAGVAADTGVRFVDVALMAPVPPTGLRTPALASGPGAEAFVAAMAPLGMPVELAGEEAGMATTRKLLRSVVMKGLAALLVESLQAAEAAGLAGETWDNLVAQLSAADEALVRRLVEGTARHASRRVEEMEATAALLAELGIDSTMTDATTQVLRAIARDDRTVPAVPSPKTPTEGAGAGSSRGSPAPSRDPAPQVERQE
jgi:3-hydroxyisobutyrate dehydrogenase-like beta-hydroxyacid dehydrogenase